MRFPRKKTLFTAAMAASLCLSTAAVATASKFDARLLARRGAQGGGLSPAGAGAPIGGPRRSVFLRLAPGTTLPLLRAAFPNADFGSRSGEVVTVHADDSALDSLAQDGRIQAISAGVLAHPTMDVVRSNTTSGGLALGTVYGSAATDLAGATGAGVVIGFVDTGIDFRHLDFVNDGPNTSRILSIWDQTISPHAGGPSPAGFSYGAEYTNAQLTAKLQGGGGVINTEDAEGHGTHVASIAAGDGSATNGALAAGTFKGMAPSADIIAVRTTFNTVDVIDGVNYILSKAAAAGKRAVINLSLGTQAGPHDGTSEFEDALGVIAAGTPVVVAIGNDGASSAHAGVNVGTGGSAAINVDAAAADVDADIEFWHPGSDAYRAVVTLSGIGGSLTAAAGTDQSSTLGGHVIEIYNGTNAGHPLGDKQIYVYVHRASGITTPTINVTLTRTLSGGTGRVDGWVDPWGEGISFASHQDATRSLSEPAGALNAFGIGSYASKKTWNAIDDFTYWFTDQSALGNLSEFSSQGPTRDGRQQPEVAAPGDVIAAALSAATTAYPGDAYVLTDGRHRIERGTSMAAPVVAGILAARLQWGPTRTVAQLREILRSQARTDGATGAVPTYAWGFGKAASSPQPTAAPTGLSAVTLGISSVSWNWSAVVGADAYSLYYGTNPTVLLASDAAPPYVLTGLAANTTTSLVVKGSGAGVDGPPAFVSAATLVVAPAALPTATPHVASVTVSWTPCPASPAAVSCWGYAVSASTAANGTGTLLSSATLNRASSVLVVTGLQQLTQYYVRLSALNFYGVPTATGPVITTTLSNLLAPTAPQFSGATTSSIRFDWNSANAAGLTYVADASTSSVFAGVVLSSSTKNFYAVFSGMAANTSYYFRAKAVGGPYLAPAAPVATLALPPAFSTPSIAAISAAGFTVRWSSAGNPGGSLYQAEISAGPGFSPLVGSSSTRNAFADFTGLTQDTLYYARVRAVSHGGITTAYASLGSTRTYVPTPTLPAEPFSGQSATGFTFSFNSGGNLAGTVYIVRVSTEPSFSTLTSSAAGTGAAASFSGLKSNTLYYAAVAALNSAGTPSAYTTAASTATTVIAVGAPAVAASARTASSLSTSWTAGSLGPGTAFVVHASETADFAAIAGSSTTTAVQATVSGLNSNTIHYLRARALSSNPPTQDGPWTTLGTASTLAGAPSSAAEAFPVVGVASMSIAWTALPLAPPASACEGYLVELSTGSSFATIARSSVVAPGAESAGLSGLLYDTLYYARVGALNSEGVPNYLAVGSTRTAVRQLSIGTVGGGELILAMSSSFASLPGVTVQIEPGTFPPGTVVTMLAGVTVDLTNPRSAVARLTALGDTVGLEISAGGLQPLKPVRLTIAYDPAALPPGADERRLLVGRYDDASALWTLVPSAVDTASRRIFASLDHFSSYAPFLAAAGAALSDGIVFPQPWEAGEPSGPYGAQALTFANYPDGTKVRLTSLTGEQIWQGIAGVNGVLTWDGRNRYGRGVASGTYYAIIEGAGARKVRRVVVIR